MEIITTTDLASYLRDLTVEDQLHQIVDLTNGLISEEWVNPVEPAPFKVQLLALAVGARAWSHNPATAHLESVTRSLDDANRTERYRSTSDQGSVYLTDSERAYLAGGIKVGSVRLFLPGDLP